jgi:hypothetical protein
MTAKKHPRVRTLQALLPLAASVAFGACSEAEEEKADEYIEACNPASPSAPYASQESFRAFMAADEAGKLIVDDSKVPQVTLFPEGKFMSVSIPPTFNLSAPKPTSASRGDSRSREDGAGGRPSVRRPRGVWARLRSALSLERQAHAQAASCPPFTGENVLFRLTNVRTPKQHAFQAVLSVNKYIPEKDLWVAAMSGRIGITTKLTLMRAVFKDGAIVEGPYIATQPPELMVLP